MKKSVLATTLSLLAVAVLASCTSGGKKKKTSATPSPTSGVSTTSGGGQPGEVTEEAWKRGFAGCVSVGAQSAIEGVASHVMPSKPESSIVNLTKTKSWQDTKEFVTYEFTYNYELDQDPWKTGETETKEAHYVQKIDDDPAKTYKVVSFKNWPSQAAEQADWPRFNIKAKCQCNNEQREKTFTLILDPLDKVYIVMSFEDIYTMNEGHLKWTKMGQDGGYVGDLDQTESQNRYWVETWGRIVYATQDGNWGLVANGDKVLQLYRLDEMGNKWNRNLIGKDVVIKTALDFGYGNPQGSYVQDIAEIEAGDTTHPVAEPAADLKLTSDLIGNKDWTTNKLFNRIAYIENATYEGNLRSVKNASSGGGTTIVEIAEDKKSSITPTSVRYEFDIKVNGVRMVVATDYHAAKSTEEAAVATAYKNMIVNATVGGSIKIGGTVRWGNPRKTSPSATTLDITNSHMIMANDSKWAGYTDYDAVGGWNIVPFLASQIS